MLKARETRQKLEESVATLLSEKKILQNKLEQTRGYVSRLELRKRIHRSQSPPHASKSLKLPDPPLFTGSATDDLDFENWLTRITGKLAGNADHFTNEALKLAYVVNRLAGDAAKHTAPRLREGSPLLYQTAAELLDHLREIYIDPAKQDKVREAFKNLYMKALSFYTFYTWFLYLSGEAQIPCSDLVRELHDKLSFELRDKAMAKYLEAPMLTEYAWYCTQMDHQNQRNKALKNRLLSQIVLICEAISASTYGPCALCAPATSNTTPTAIPARTSPSPDARPQYSDPAKQALSRIGVCFICKKPGHLAKYCP